MTPLYETEFATGEFANLGEVIPTVLFRSIGALNLLGDKEADEQFIKATETIKGLPGGLGWEERRRRQQEKAFEAYQRGRPCCDSPIEKMLLPWLICQQYAYFDFHPSVLLPGETDQYVPGSLAIIPQLPVGRYRVDFALAGSLGGPIRFVVVECDGKEFHDGVKNVKRDVDRDVAILANKRVLDVVRFDGRDILRDPQSCAWRAAHAVTLAWAKGNPSTAEKFAP